MFTKFIDNLEWGLEKSAALMCLVLLASLFTEVLTRYVFFMSIPEIQFIVPFCFLWMVMFGSAIAVRRGQHFEVDLLQKIFKGKTQAAHRTLLMLIVMAGGLIIVWSSFSFLELGMLKKNPATGVRMIYIYTSIFVGGALIALMALDRLLNPNDTGPDDAEAVLEANKVDFTLEDLK